MGLPDWLHELILDQAKRRDRLRVVAAAASTIVGPAVLTVGGVFFGLGVLDGVPVRRLGLGLVAIGTFTTLIFGAISATVMPTKFLRLILEFERLEQDLRRRDQEIAEANDRAAAGASSRALVEQMVLDVTQRVRCLVGTSGSLEASVRSVLSTTDTDYFWHLFGASVGGRQSLSVFTPGLSEPDELVCIFRRRAWAPDVPSRRIPAREDGGGYIGLAYSRRSPFQHGDLRTLIDRRLESWRPEDDQHYVSLIAVPIVAEDRVCGVLCVTSDVADHLGPSRARPTHEQQQYLVYAAYLADMLSLVIGGCTLEG